MKRLFILLLILLMIVCALSACVVNIPTFSALPSSAGFLQTPIPLPTPSPKPRAIAVFGAEDAAAFLEGVTTAAADTGIDIVSVKGGIEALSTFAPETDAAAIVYLSQEAQAIPPANIPVYAYASTGQSVSGGVLYLGYDGASEAQLALTSALAYPPHLTPVRMIGLFTSQTSAAYTLYANAKAAGQVLSKMEFFEDATEASAKDSTKDSSKDSADSSTAVSPEAALEGWLSDAFSRYYPGMLDAVYAETGALAIAAADVLASLGRSDIEVFAAATDAQSEAKLSQILVCVVGANERDAGARCFAETKKLLEGEEAQSGILLPEAIWYSPKPN